MPDFASDLLISKSPKVAERKGNQAKIVLEPLERGFGHTLGNALRRALLSAMPGNAISEVRIAGVLHEYSTIEGCREDTQEILLNLKELSIKMGSAGPETLRLQVQGPKVVTAADIQTPGDLSILNKDHVICALNEDGQIDMEMKVESGCGYRPISQGADGGAAVGVLKLDVTFGSIVTADYSVENARLKGRTDLDKLILNIETDGTVDPEDAVRDAAHILTRQLKAVSGKEDIDDPVEYTPKETLFPPILLRPIEDLDLTVRSTNCLRAENILYIGDLIHRTAEDLLRTPNLGKVSLGEIERSLAEKELKLDTVIEHWPPENLSKF